MDDEATGAGYMRQKKTEIIVVAGDAALGVGGLIVR